MTGKPHDAVDAVEAADREARWTAITEFERPLLVEAGAGTGKTSTLVGRVLAWSLGHGWDLAEERSAEPARADEVIAARVLDGVVAITFTEAAAAEMAERVAGGLAQIADGDTDLHGFELTALPRSLFTDHEGRARALLAALDHLTVRTIHAFCRGLLSAHPLEADLHPYFAVDADGLALDEVVREQIELRLGEARPRPDDPLSALAAHRISPRALANAALLASESGLTAAALTADPGSPERLAAHAHSLQTSCETLRDRGRALRSLPSRQLAPRLMTQVDDTLARLGAFHAESAGAADALVAIAAAWPANLIARLKKWRRLDFSQAEATAAGRGDDDIGRAAAALATLLAGLVAWDGALLNAGRRALAPLLTDVGRELRSRGIVTFNALLVETERMLRGRTRLRRTLRRRIDQLLVDEFQDTDSLQCSIVRQLALAGRRDDRPGLFVVGDPKQSIFGWRDADLAAYEAFERDLLKAGGDVLYLRRNFRSVPEVLTEVEAVIDPVMKRQPGLQPPFASLIASSGRESAGRLAELGRRPVEHWISWAGPEPEKTRADEAARVEAEAVAADIRELGEAGWAWSDFALLLRSTGRQETFLAALRDAGVPFVVSRDKSYYRRREIVDAAALVRTILDPLDHLALVAALRSPFAGLPDAALAPLWRHGFPALMSDLVAPDPDRLTAVREAIAGAASTAPTGLPGLDALSAWPVAVTAAVERIAILRRSFHGEPSDVFVDRLRRLSAVEGTEAARYLGPFRVANLERFFRRLETTIDLRGGSPSAVLREMAVSVRHAREAEEAQPKESSKEAVQVLTIHRAKGLEFAHVYVAQLHTTPDGSGSEELTSEAAAVDGEPPEYRLFRAETPGYRGALVRRRRVTAAEQIRTLYVAMTRAVDRLVMVGCWPTKGRRPTPERAQSHLDLVRARAPQPPDLLELWTASSAAGEDGAVIDGVRWRFPALGAAAPARAAARGRQDDAATHPDVDLEPSRKAARERMLRPFGDSASQAESTAATWAPPSSEPAHDSDRPSALAAGSAVHALLETWNLAAEPGSELDLARARLPTLFPRELAPADRAAATARVERVLSRLAGGPFPALLSQLGESVIARELPVLLPPEGSAATGYVTGAIDLLYREPGGRLVLVDYKTDEVDGAAVRSRAAGYAAQQAVYRRAIVEALQPDEVPRVELWFLWAGEIVVLPEPEAPLQST